MGKPHISTRSSHKPGPAVLGTDESAASAAAVWTPRQMPWNCARLASVCYACCGILSGCGCIPISNEWIQNICIGLYSGSSCLWTSIFSLQFFLRYGEVFKKPGPTPNSFRFQSGHLSDHSSRTSCNSRGSLTRSFLRDAEEQVAKQLS